MKDNVYLRGGNKIASDLFYHLTRDLKEGDTLTITEMGGDGDTPEEIYRKGTVFYYGNQYLYRNRWQGQDDRFGRNQLDCAFIALCLEIYTFRYAFVFKSLAVRKDGDRYLVRVRYDDVDLEMEVVEAFHYFTKLLGKQKWAHDAGSC